MSFNCIICTNEGRGVIHHDHLHVFADKLMKDLLKNPNIQSVLDHYENGLNKDYQKLVADFARFEPTKICETCNSREGNLKLLRLGIRVVDDKHFSFSPDELERILGSTVPIESRLIIASAVYVQAWRDYHVRREFLELLLRDLAKQVIAKWIEEETGVGAC